MAQRLRIRLPVQGTRVRALGREDPTCRGATTEATTTGPARRNYWGHVLQLLTPAHLCSATREAIAMRSLRAAMKTRRSQN